MAQARELSPLPLRATVTDGRFHLKGLKPGELYQLGARVPGCGTAKLVVADAGFFVAGKTQAPAVAIVAPPKVVRTGNTFSWTGGTATTGASYALSVGDSPTTCAAAKGVVATGELSGSAGRFDVDPRRLEPRIPSAGTPYKGALHLRVIRKGGPCVPSFDLSLPLAVAGLPQSGETQLEVYDHPKLATELGGNCDVCSGWPYDPQYWATSSAFDWTAPELSSRPFHWASSAPGTTDGQWQLSTAPLPDSCKPTGLVASGPTGFAPGPLATDSTHTPPLFTIDFKPYGLDQGTTYYLRVVPVNSQGGCSGPASPSMTLTYKEKPTSGGCLLGCLPSPSKPPPQAATLGVVLTYQPLTGAKATPPYCFQAVKDHTVTSSFTEITSDVVGFVAVGMGKSIAAGTEVCFTPDSGGDKSFWDDLESVADFVLDVVSFPAKVYDLFEQIIPSILAELIPGCDDTCRDYLLAAEKVGLAAVGLPPSLPDASRLVHDGEDYLVGQAAEAGGVSEEAARAAYDKGKEAMIAGLASTSSQQTGLTCDWCAFDNGVRAPGVKIQVLRASNDDPSIPMPERVCIGNTASALSAPSPYYLASPLYDGSCARLPRPFPPGSILTLPMSLTANLRQLKQDAVNRFAASNSQLGGSDSELDALAFQEWLGQKEHTPLLSFQIVSENHYDAGTGFPHQLIQKVLATATFPGG